MIERAKGQVLVWADLPEGQRAQDSDADVVVPLALTLRGRSVPLDAVRCEAASQGNTTDCGLTRHLVKAGRFFRCVQRRKRGLADGRFCVRHQVIAERGAAAVRPSATRHVRSGI